MKFSRKPFLSLLKAFTCLVMVFFGLSLPLEFVVCYGSDGHVAIELVGDNDCSGLTFGHVPDQKQSISHCGKCTDVPLVMPDIDTDSVKYHTPDLKITLLSLGVVSDTTLYLNVKTIPKARLAQPPPLLLQSLRDLKTVVLTI